MKPVFHSSSVRQPCRGNRTSHVESAHFTWKQAHTHTHKCTCTCMQTNTVPCLIRQAVINTCDVLVRPQLCHRVFTELQFLNVLYIFVTIICSVILHRHGYNTYKRFLINCTKAGVTVVVGVTPCPTGALAARQSGKCTCSSKHVRKML